MALGIVTFGIVGYLAFWFYFLSRGAGTCYSALSLLLCCAITGYAWARGRNQIHRAVCRRLILTWLVVGLSSLLIISIAFLYGKPESIQEYAAQRFGPPSLSIDNFVPKILADDVYEGHIPKPMIGDWLSSDRPPEQSGLALWDYPWTHGNRDLTYQLLGVMFQVSCLAGLLAYLEGAQVKRKAIALVLSAVIFSGFTFFNSFFSWPKLLPAAFLFVVAAYMLTDGYESIRSDWRVGALVGAAASLAMLSHGGSAFALIGLVLTLLLLRRVPHVRFIVAAALAAILLYLPWTLYQKYYDPPGDRLQKIHLAGEINPSTESLGQLLAKNYRKLSLEQIAEYKLANLKFLADKEPFWYHLAMLLRAIVTGNKDQLAGVIASLRWIMFMHWGWSIDVFSFTPLAFLAWVLFIRRKSVEVKLAWCLWLFTGITLVVWCLLMFWPAQTWVHQGSYFTELTAMTAGVLALWSISPILAVVFTALHIVLNMAVYVLLTPSTEAGLATFAGPKNVPLAVLSVLIAALLAVVLIKIGQCANGASSHEQAIQSEVMPLGGYGRR